MPAKIPRVTTAMLGEMLGLHPSSAARVARAYGFEPDRRHLPNKNRTVVLTWSPEQAREIKGRYEMAGLYEPEPAYKGRP